jgi:hypothetical protein
MKNLLVKSFFVGLLVVIGYLGIVNYKLQSTKRKLEASQAAQLIQIAKLEGAIKETPVKVITVKGPVLTKFVTDTKKVGGKPVEHTVGTVDIQTKDAGHETIKDGQKLFWDDEHHRFHLDIPTGVFSRHQAFRFEALVVQGPTGDRVSKAILDEMDPILGTPIQEPGLKFDYRIEFSKESAPTPGPIHPTAVLAVDSGLGIGGGINLLDYKHVTFSVLGTYDRSAKKGHLWLNPGYRINLPWVETNLSIGPTYDPFSRSVGAAFTLQITR